MSGNQKIENKFEQLLLRLGDEIVSRKTGDVAPAGPPE